MKRVRIIGFICILSICACSLLHARLDAKRFEQITQVERQMIKVAEDYFGRKKWKQAENEFTKYIKIYQESVASPYAQFHIAYCIMEQKKINEAISEFTAVLDYFPKSPEAPVAQRHIGICYLRSADRPNAIKAFQKTIDKYPKHIETFYALWNLSNDIYEHLDSNDKILKKRNACYYKMITEFKYGGSYYYKRYWENAFNRLFSSYLWGKKESEARKIGKIRWKPEDIEFKIAYQYRDIAVHHLRKGDVGASEEYAELAGAVLDGFAARFPDKKDKILSTIWATGDLHASFAKTFKLKKRQEKYIGKAVKKYKEYTQKAPDSKQAKALDLIIGKLYGDTGRIVRAIEFFTKYVDKHKSDGARGAAGGYLKDKKQYEHARKFYEMFESKKVGAWNIAECYHNEKNGKKAIEWYEKVVTLWPEKSTDAKYNEGDVYQRILRDFKKAISAYRQSNKIPDSIFRVGECNSAMGKHKTAINVYQEILFLRNPGHSSQALWRIAHEYEKMKDRKKMINTLRGLINRYKKSREASWAHQKLEKMGLKTTGGAEE
ncbi:tetratricopeptide repeat protein [Planctomycetota bacterium]